MTLTPESSDCLNRIKRDGASSEAQFNNREAGIPSGPAAEFGPYCRKMLGLKILK